MFDVKFEGKSRDKEISVTIKGFPINYIFDMKKLQEHVDRRKATRDIWSTERLEEDIIQLGNGFKKLDNNKVEIVSSEIEFKILNKDVKNDSNINICRPGHADYVSYLKYKEIYPGGGPFSGRITVLLAIAGGLCKQYLENKFSMQIVGYISSIGEMEGVSYKNSDFDLSKLDFSDNYFIAFQENKKDFRKIIQKCAEDGDTVGGSIECIVLNMKSCVGGPILESLEGCISKYIFAIPAIKSIEFGLGNDFAKSYGTQVIDAFQIQDGKVSLINNYNGGINGGISNGMPLTFRIAVKPISSIKKEVNLLEITNNGENRIIKSLIQGRNDVCILPRMTVLVESAVALAIMENIC